MPLDARIEAARLRDLYKEDPKQSSFNLLLMGETGTGKTYLARTARKPVHIDSFDPSGTLCLREQILKGDIVVDTQYESEDPKSPKMFSEWCKNFEMREKDKYFESFGTYMLDSSTMFAEAIMNSILKAANLTGQAPRFTHDYVPQKVLIHNWFKRILALPCDVIVTGHVEPIKDEVLGSVEYRYMTTGKGATIIPLLFTEKWIAHTKQTPSGVEYQILTQRTGKYIASSSIAAGKLDTFEVPDIKKILTKCGWDSKDKSGLFGSK